MTGVINADASHIWDDAEAWIMAKADAGGDITSKIPASPDADFAALGWLFVGLIDAKKGIPVDPKIDVKKFDGFGYPSYRTKASKGEVTTGFTALEDNATTARIVLPGSDADHIGIPKDMQFYVLYRTVDQGLADEVRVSKRPALLELKSHSGAVEGEQESYEFVAHHSPDENKDIFKRVRAAVEVEKTFTIAGGVTAYTVTVDGQTTASISTLTAAALRTALEALANVGAGNATVTGSSGGPLTAKFTVPVTAVSAAGTGGTVTVA